MRTCGLLVGVVAFAGCGDDSDVRHLPDAPTVCSSLAVDAPNSDAVVTGLVAVPATGFTWELWFNAAVVPTSTANQIRMGASMMVAADMHSCEDVYVGFGTESTPANELSFVLDGLGECAARDMTPLHYLPPAGFVQDHWYFVAVSHDYESGTSKLYLDGAMVATKQSTAAPITGYVHPITIGRWADGKPTDNYNQFHGALDEVVIYNRAIDDAQIVSDYANGAGRFHEANEADVIAGFHFDEGEGTVARDFVGRAHDGVVEGAGYQAGLVCSD